jgi:hypothetical protein
VLFGGIFVRKRNRSIYLSFFINFLANDVLHNVTETKTSEVTIIARVSSSSGITHSSQTHSDVIIAQVFSFQNIFDAFLVFSLVAFSFLSSVVRGFFQ